MNASQAQARQHQHPQEHDENRIREEDGSSHETLEIFANLPLEEKVAIFVLCVLCLPMEEKKINWNVEVLESKEDANKQPKGEKNHAGKEHGTSTNDSKEKDEKGLLSHFGFGKKEEGNHIMQTFSVTWNQRIISLLENELSLPESYFEAYKELVPSREGNSDKQFTVFEMLEPFVDVIRRSEMDTFSITIRLAVFLILNGAYDARGREFLRNICYILKLDRDLFISLENSISAMLHNAKGILGTTSKQRNTYTFGRIAKIGTVAIGAGALLAVTGGLAAPAIAAALIAFGSTAAMTAAGLTTATIMASVFGTAGAGLSGYKMIRRTSGLQEFEFENQGSGQDHLAIMIVVSGYLIDKNDYRRFCGMFPKDIGPEERLERFYEVHCPSRVSKAKDEAEDWKDDLDHLYDQMRDAYGKDPREESSLMFHNFPVEPLTDSRKAMLIKLTRTAIGSDKSNDSSNLETIQLENRPNGTSEKETKSSDNFILNGISSGTDMISSGISSTTSMVSKGFKSIFGSNKQKQNAESIKQNHNYVSEATKADDNIALNFNRKYWNWTEHELSAVYDLSVLRWETELQQELGKSIMSLLASLRDAAIEQAVKATFLAALASAVFLPYTIIKFLDIIDGAWTLAVERADEAGKELAEALLQRPQGSRAVTLVGHSMGARVIFSCLLELSKRIPAAYASLEGDNRNTNATLDDISNNENKEDEIEERKSGTENNTNSTNAIDIFNSIVQDVVLLGAPVPSKKRLWRRIRSVVAGRLINGYCKNDLVLALIYRYEAKTLSVAGVKPMKVEGVENLDLSEIVENHADYTLKFREIMAEINLISKPYFIVQSRGGSDENEPVAGMAGMDLTDSLDEKEHGNVIDDSQRIDDRL